MAASTAQYTIDSESAWIPIFTGGGDCVVQLQTTGPVYIAAATSLPAYTEVGVILEDQPRGEKVITFIGLDVADIIYARKPDATGADQTVVVIGK